MINWLYHYIYQDVYIPVWPNIVASIIVGAWVIWRNKTHIERVEKRFKRSLGSEMEKVHARISHIHSAGSDNSDSSSGDTPLFAHQEIEQSRQDAN